MHSSWKSRGGGGPLGFLPNSLEGVLGVVRKSRGPPFRVLFHFYDQIFQILPPMCIYALHILIEVKESLCTQDLLDQVSRLRTS